MLDANFVDKILEVSTPWVQPIDGVQFSNKALKQVMPQEVDCLEVHALSAIPAFLGSGAIVAAHYFVHAVSHDRVEVCAIRLDSYGRRATVLSCVPVAVEPFPFGTWLESERFIIGLQSKFVPSVGLEDVLRIASNLTGEDAVVSQDDGISQRVTVKKGMAFKESVTLSPLVKLAPYRTFPELEQPTSDFLFRVKGDGGSRPLCALFEADGGRWKLAAMSAITEWLVTYCPENTTIIS